MFRQLLVKLGQNQSVIKPSSYFLLKCHSHTATYTLGIIDIAKSQDRSLSLKVSESVYVNIKFRAKSVGYATASLKACYDSIKQIVKEDFYFYDVYSNKIQPMTDRLAYYDSSSQQYQDKQLGIVKIAKLNQDSKFRKQVVLHIDKRVEMYRNKINNQQKTTQEYYDNYTLTMTIAVELHDKVSDVIKCIEEHMKADIKPTTTELLKITSTKTSATIESLICSNSKLMQSEYVLMTDLFDLIITNEKGSSNSSLIDYVKIEQKRHDACVNGSFLQDILPVDCLNKTEPLSIYLPTSAPSLLLIRLPNELQFSDMKLAIKSPSGLFQQTEKPDTRYRLLSIITGISGYYDVLSNHNDYSKLEQGCKLMSNVEGEMTVSLNEIMPRVNYMLYQLATSMDD